MANVAAQRPCVIVDEKLNFAIDMRPLLRSGELLTGTPDIIEEGGTDLTFSSESRNVVVEEILLEDVPVDQAVLFHAVGFVAAKVYSLLITVTTNATPTPTRKGRIKFPVVA